MSIPENSPQLRKKKKSTFFSMVSYALITYLLKKNKIQLAVQQITLILKNKYLYLKIFQHHFIQCLNEVFIFCTRDMLKSSSFNHYFLLQWEKPCYISFRNMNIQSRNKGKDILIASISYLIKSLKNKLLKHS